MIQNKDNVIAISKGIHRKISGYYSRGLDGLRIRDWLSGQSYEKQYEFGLKILKMFGG